ncbi:MAG: hypothetical protein J07AB43_16970 [Candidatus Nanosalina sp. J07AB43]|jgi:hypothetical protein|nr:MAG: hypothetical protein J07AB43_16970 [Candidatus Nanosalina sp. J07AB43]
MPDASAQFSTTYTPDVETYELQVQEGRTITTNVPEAGSSSTEFLNYNIQNTVIRNAEDICIKKKSDQVTLERGPCGSPDLDDFCENGRCINDICQPERGETCANSGGDCTCSTQCQPGYEAGTYMNPIQGAGDGNDDTNQTECVLPKFVGALDSNGSECEYDFECGTNPSGQDLQCNQPAPGSPPTGSYCCPSGTNYDGNQCKDVKRVKLVFVPLNTKNGAYSYDSGVSTQSSFFKQVYPISSQSVEVEKISNICNVDVDQTSCSTSDRVDTLSQSSSVR